MAGNSVKYVSCCMGKKEKWNLLCGSCVFPWIWSVPLPESAGGTALFIQTNHLFIPVLVHGLCNFSNFFMNEILGWNYTVWKYDDILQGVLAVFYLIAGLYVVYRSVQKKQNIRRKTEK